MGTRAKGAQWNVFVFFLFIFNPNNNSYPMPMLVCTRVSCAVFSFRGKCHFALVRWPKIIQYFFCFLSFLWLYLISANAELHTMHSSAQHVAYKICVQRRAKYREFRAANKKQCAGTNIYISAQLERWSTNAEKERATQEDNWQWDYLVFTLFAYSESQTHWKIEKKTVCIIAQVLVRRAY